MTPSRLLCVVALLSGCDGRIGDSGADPTASGEVPLVANQPPHAFAAFTPAVFAPGPAQLNGAQSSDADGRLVRFRWTQGTGPNVARFDDEAKTNPVVSGLAAGTYRFFLEVTDDRGATNTDYTELLVLQGSGPTPNAAPVVGAGADQTTQGTSVALNGSASDADGTIVSRAWSKKSGGAAAIAAPSSAATAITGLAPGTYVFTFTATDDDGASASDDVQVTVSASPAGTARVCGVANEWVAYPTMGTLALACPAGQTIQSVSFASYGTPGGTCGAFTASACSAPTSQAVLTTLCVGKASCSATNFNALFGDPCPGTSKRIHAQVECGGGGVPPVNAAPVANAGADQSTTATTATLNGAATDTDGAIASVAWTKKSGGAAAIGTPAGLSTGVSGLVPGVYVFMLTVTDDDGAVTADDVQVTVTAPGPNPNPVTALSFSAIPATDPDLVAPGRGLEIWHGDSQGVAYPTDGAGVQSQDHYFRFAWSQLETARDVYDWTRFDNEAKAAIAAGRKFAFGVMTVCPGCDSYNGMVNYAGSDAAYPQYLHADMQGEATKDWLSTRAGNWIPNWNSPAYLSRFEKLLQVINTHLETTSHNGVLFKNAVHYIDVRGYGSWGEWHNGGVVDNLGDAAQQPQAARATAQSLNRLIDAHVTAFPNHTLVTMISTFDANRLQNTLNPPAVGLHALQVQNARGFLGWRRDNWGCLDDRCGDYLRYYSDLHPDLTMRALIMDRWKLAPINGEPMNGGSVVGDASGSTCYYWELKTQVERYHASSFGNGNFQGVTSAQCARDNVRAAAKASGYRLVLTGGSLTSNVGASRQLSMRLDWRNAGLTPTYEDWAVTFELRNAAGATAWSGTSAMALRLFLPAAAAQAQTDAFVLPGSVPAGSYTLRVVVKDPKGFRAPLPLAILGRATDGSYALGSVVVP